MLRSRIGEFLASAARKRTRSVQLLLVGAAVAGAAVSLVVSSASATGPHGPPTTAGSSTFTTVGNPPPVTTPNPPPPSGTMVTATRITRAPGTLPRGSRVSARDLSGPRTFLDANHGYGLATVGEADYPVLTTDGGKTWRTDGPAVHLHAAQAPLVVTDAGAANRRTLFACCGGQAVDATGDGGKHWWRALLGDVVLAVTTHPGGKLIAIAQTATGTTGSQAATWVYVSKDGGHHWRLDSQEGAN